VRRSTNRPARWAGLFHCVHRHQPEPSRSSIGHVKHLGFLTLTALAPRVGIRRLAHSRDALTWDVDTAVDTFVDVRGGPTGGFECVRTVPALSISACRRRDVFSVPIVHEVELGESGNLAPATESDKWGLAPGN
jgi:hypothetical protein